jgi:ribonuclease VapC
MVIDTSAVVAILRGEAVAERLELAIEADPVRLLSAASLIECAIVMEARLGDIGGRELDLLIHKGGLDVVAVGLPTGSSGRADTRPRSTSATRSPMPSR